MSKHKKQVRRERMKTERGRRWRSLFDPKSEIRNPKSVPAALAAAAAIAGGTMAYASPVRFDNPPGEGRFQWSLGPTGGANALDLTVGPGEQEGGNIQGPTHVRQMIWASGDGAMLLGAPDPFVQVETTTLYYYGNPYQYVEGVDAGILIPSGRDWYSSGYSFLYSMSLLPEGAPTYVGVRFNSETNPQYAWIGVVRTGNVLDAFAWGYETEAGVSIPAGAVPEPGTLALLALGAVAVAGRRQRGNQATSENRLGLTAP